jgi:hypothetical protein
MSPCPRLAGRVCRHGGWRRRGRHRRRRGQVLGRLMRHFSFSAASNVLPLPRGMGPPSSGCRLVPVACLAQRRSTSSLTADVTAVAVAPVAPGAQEEHLPALPPGACHQPQRLLHRTRCTPFSGARPCPGVRLVLPRARQHTGTPRQKGLSVPLRGSSSIGRAFPPHHSLSHRPPTVFESPPPNPHLNCLAWSSRSSPG